ncbi:MAG: lysoplasmalogenase [Oscillospiraceae bacterium]|jgi:uncharacterized membrane protein YhhN|nr:lysoplasmalogenase [Oscillospiraceae bacterium]
MLIWKLLFTGSLAAAMFALAVSRHAPVYWLAMGAVMFSWLGDASLGGFKPLTRSMSNPSLWGLGFFAAGHLCYIAAFTVFIRLWPQSGRRTPLMLAAFAAAAVAAWWFVCWRSGQPMPLRAASLAYALTLFAMACMAWVSAARLADASRFVWPLALGGALFIISDGMIAMNWFQGWNSRWRDLLIWGTYAPAQLLLAIGFWLLRAPGVSAAAKAIGL